MSNRLLTILTWGVTILVAWLSALSVKEGEYLKVIAVLLGIAFTVVCFVASEGILPILLLVTLALGSSYRWDVATKSFWLRFFLLSLICLRAVALVAKPKGFNDLVNQQRQTLLHLLFLSVCAFGIALSMRSVDPWLSFQRALSFLLLYVVIFIYFSIRGENRAQSKDYVMSLWKGFFLILSVGYVLLLVRRNQMLTAGRLRLILVNPNTLGHYCALMAPIVIWVLFEGPGQIRRVWRWGALGLLFLSLVWSGSRGALITTLMALTLQFVLSYRKKLFWLFFSVAFIASAHALMGDPTSRPGDETTFIEQNVIRQNSLFTGSGRSGIWEAARNLVRKRPVFGYGFASVDRLFQLGYFPELQEFQGGHVHNSYLEELVNLGWLGAAPLFLALIYVLLTGVGSLVAGRRNNDEDYRFAIALFCVFIAGCVSGVFESWFTSVGSIFCFPFWFCAMLFVKASRHMKDRDPTLSNMSPAISG